MNSFSKYTAIPLVLVLTFLSEVIMSIILINIYSENLAIDITIFRIPIYVFIIAVFLCIILAVLYSVFKKSLKGFYLCRFLSNQISFLIFAYSISYFIGSFKFSTSMVFIVFILYMALTNISKRRIFKDMWGRTILYFEQAPLNSVLYKDIYLPPTIKKLKLSDNLFKWLLVSAVVIVMFLSDFRTKDLQLTIIAFIEFSVLHLLVQNFSHWGFFFHFQRKYEKETGRRILLLID